MITDEELDSLSQTELELLSSKVIQKLIVKTHSIRVIPKTTNELRMES